MGITISLILALLGVFLFPGPLPAVPYFAVILFTCLITWKIGGRNGRKGKAQRIDNTFDLTGSGQIVGRN